MRPPHVLITGGSRGIGLSIAHLFARHSHRCTLLSRTEAPLRAAVASLPTPSTSTKHAYITGDIASPSFWSLSGIGAQLPAKDETSKIDVLVNCAGVTQGSLFAATDAEKMRGIVDTNLTGVMLGTRYLLRNRYLSDPRSKRESSEEGNGGGNKTRCIINVASLLATHGGHGAVAYAASKAGVLGFTRALASEVGRLGIRVNAVVPGYVETDMTGGLDHAALSSRIPLGRLGKPEEIASAALFLAQNQYAHNCVINLDGGLSAV